MSTNSDTNDQGNTHLPLAGARVVDFSRLLPGPWCTQTLADLGADVIKVEQPEIGDYGRFNPPMYKSVGAYFNSVNRNKRSIALDLGNPEDYATARKLIDTADVLVESFRAGVTENLKIDHATVSQTNASLIYCSVTGLGNNTAMGRVPGHDLSVQAVSGILGKHLTEHSVPPMPSFQAGDYAAASYATIGVLSAYIRRMQTGQGCYLEIPMFDSLLCAAPVSLSGAFARLTGGEGTPEMEPWGRNPRYAIYPTRDGKAVAVCLLEARGWHRFCTFIGRTDLIYDEDWSDRHTSHGAYSGAFRDAISAYCASHDRDELAEKMKTAGISITPVYSADEALRSAHAKERDIVRFSEHPTDGQLPYIHDPLMQAGLSQPNRMPSPELGEHTDALKAELAAIPQNSPLREDT